MDVLVVIDNYFPFGSAISKRMDNFCKLLNEIGFSVHVIASFSKRGDNNDCLEYCTYEIAAKRSMKRIDSYTTCFELYRSVYRYIRKNQVDVCFISCDSLKILGLLHSFKIPIIKEQCEWRDSSNFTFGKKDIRYIKNQVFYQYGFKIVDGFISITHFLDDYFRKNNKKSIVIPSILEVKENELRKATGNKEKVIVYTGNPGKSKELFRPILEALHEDDNLQKHVRFDIYGPTKEKLIQNIDDEDILSMIDSCVYIHRYKSEEEIYSILCNADYQIFIKPYRKASNAGFPTKLAESFASGLPVITNLTGDIGDYLKDDFNGIVLSGIDKCDVRDALNRIVGMPQEKYEEMRVNAYNTAKHSFDYSIYADRVKDFFYDVVNGGR